MTHTTKHTPGPWRTIESTDKTMRTVVGPDFPGQGYIADVNLCRTNDAQDVDGEANARLIAAAPAMYEALQDAYEKLCYLAPDKFDDEEHAANWQRDLSTMLAALAQAEGRG